MTYIAAENGALILLENGAYMAVEDVLSVTAIEPVAVQLFGGPRRGRRSKFDAEGEVDELMALQELG